MRVSYGQGEVVLCRGQYTGLRVVVALPRQLPLRAEAQPHVERGEGFGGVAAAQGAVGYLGGCGRGGG